MAEETWMRTGRGGAGNFRTELECPTSVVAPQTQPKTPDFVRTGRGGLGNVLKTAELPTEPAALPQKITDKVNISKPPHRGLTGRGGAGNWGQVSEDEERRKAEEDAKIQDRVNEQARIDVDSIMKPPPRAHAAPDNYGDDMIWMG